MAPSILVVLTLWWKSQAITTVRGKKFDFYATVGVREFLLVDRNPWQLELYALRGKKLVLPGRGDVADGKVPTSQVLTLSFRQITPSKSGRPQIEIARTTDGQRWLA